MFQFTRPRGARRAQKIAQITQQVSIHAPTRGATAAGAAGRFARVVSIHAPTRGATGRDRRTARSTRCFNSRAHEGRDPEQRAKAPRRKRVSIHAPTRGATGQSADEPRIWLFQFTRPRGARLATVSAFATRAQFQFTRPRGARHWEARYKGASKSFNSRAHEGRD